MSHYLARLVERTLGTARRVEPIIAPLFAAAPLSEISQEPLAPTRPTSPEVQPATAATSSRPATPEFPPVTAATPSPPSLVRQKTNSAAIFKLAQQNSIELIPEALLVLPKQSPAPAVGQQEPAAVIAALPKRSALPAQPRRRPFVRQSKHEPPSLVSAHFLAPPNESTSQPPIVRVTIGRIDVRAAPAPAAPTRKTAPLNGPKLTLDAYLKARKEGAR
jgi:hypothetical protein